MNIAHRSASATFYVQFGFNRPCGECGKNGSYYFANKSACFQCWSISASKRGYTGNLFNDQFWSDSPEEESSNSLEKMNISHRVESINYTKSQWEIGALHIVLDLFVVGLLAFTIFQQQAKIANLERKINVLVEASSILLQDMIQRTQ